MKTILGWLVASFALSAVASEPYDRGICEILSASENGSIFAVHILSGSDMCYGKQCFAASYTAKVVKSIDGKKSFDSGPNIKFVTSAEVQIGTEVLVIAQPIPRDARNVPFLAGGETTVLTIPADIGFLVPKDAVFPRVGGGYCRRTIGSRACSDSTGNTLSVTNMRSTLTMCKSEALNKKPAH